MKISRTPDGRRIAPAVLLLGLLFSAGSHALELQGEPVQGGLIFGQAAPGSTVRLDGDSVMVSGDGQFVIGFGRDETGERVLEVSEPGSETHRSTLAVKAREYDIQRIDGLPPKTVTPDPESLARIREEGAMVSSARARRDDRIDYTQGFIWPAGGRISGVYGSQRVLNGEPRRPHFGLDIAAPTGSPVYAPADGIITLTHPDMYYSGGTIVLDHGQGLSSSFLHLSKIHVEAGTYVRQGDLIAEIGSTGRSTGPHLDWRMNWLNRRVDPYPLVENLPLPEQAGSASE